MNTEEANSDSWQTNPGRETQKPPPPISAAGQGQLLRYALEEFRYWKGDQHPTSARIHFEDFQGEWMG